MQRIIFFLLAAVLTVATAARAQELTPTAHRFIKLADGVYAAVGSGTIQTQDTAAVIVNRDDVLLVDTNITPEATRRLVNDIKTLTDDDAAVSGVGSEIDRRIGDWGLGIGD